MSDNPLAKKLKLSPEEENLILQAPEFFKEQMKEIPHDVTPQHYEYEYVQLFIAGVEELNLMAPVALQAAKEDAKIWFCYPKKTSGIRTDINRDQGWEVVLKAGFGAVAAISIDETWSALRFRPESKVDRKGAMGKGVIKPTKDRVLEVPEYIREMLNSHPQEKKFFDGLAYTHQKDYVGWISEAKRPETRQRRLQQMLERLKEGKKRY